MAAKVGLIHFFNWSKMAITPNPIQMQKAMNEQE